MKGGKRSTWKKKQDTKTSKHSELEITKTRNTKKNRRRMDTNQSSNGRGNRTKYWENLKSDKQTNGLIKNANKLLNEGTEQE